MKSKKADKKRTPVSSRERNSTGAGTGPEGPSSVIPGKHSALYFPVHGWPHIVAMSLTTRPEGTAQSLSLSNRGQCSVETSTQLLYTIHVECQHPK